jgi:hypothetical protein
MWGTSWVKVSRSPGDAASSALWINFRAGVKCEDGGEGALTAKKGEILSLFCCHVFHSCFYVRHCEKDTVM